MFRMENLKDYTVKELHEELKNRDNLHDKIADATDGTNPIYSIKGSCEYCLELDEETGSTIVWFDGESYTINEFMDCLENI